LNYGDGSRQREAFAVIAIVCQHENRKKNGTTKAGAVRFRCKTCGASWTESTDLLGGMRIGLERAAQIINLLCEGMAVRAVARITDTSKTTILDLLTYVGERCEAYMLEHFRGLHVDDIQVDELWQYIYCKAATAERKKYVGGCGDSYTYTAIERHTKLLICWEFGRRDASHAHAFCRKAQQPSSILRVSAPLREPSPPSQKNRQIVAEIGHALC
jgi:transposase-like protein